MASAFQLKAQKSNVLKIHVEVYRNFSVIVLSLLQCSPLMHFLT